MAQAGSIQLQIDQDTVSLFEMNDSTIASVRSSNKQKDAIAVAKKYIKAVDALDQLHVCVSNHLALVRKHDSTGDPGKKPEHTRRSDVMTQGRESP